MTPLQEMARAACMYKHCISDAKGFDGCCNRILAALDEAVTAETDRMQRATETALKAERERAAVIESERDCALWLLCEVHESPSFRKSRECCGHCVGCLGAMNLALSWREEAEGEQQVEDSKMGCVACYRAMTLVHLDGLLGHNLPAFKQCPVKRAEL